VLCDVCRALATTAKRWSSEIQRQVDCLSCSTPPLKRPLPLLENVPQIQQRLQTLLDVGLGYLKLGQSATTLSGGKPSASSWPRNCRRSARRAARLHARPSPHLFHFGTFISYSTVLQRLVSLGNTIIVIEHNLDVIKSADYIVYLGPERRSNTGGRVVAAGTPEEVLARAILIPDRYFVP